MGSWWITNESLLRGKYLANFFCMFVGWRQNVHVLSIWHDQACRLRGLLLVHWFLFLMWQTSLAVYKVDNCSSSRIKTGRFTHAMDFCSSGLAWHGIARASIWRRDARHIHLFAPSPSFLLSLNGWSGELMPFSRSTPPPGACNM